MDTHRRGHGQTTRLDFTDGPQIREALSGDILPGDLLPEDLLPDRPLLEDPFPEWALFLTSESVGA